MHLLLTFPFSLGISGGGTYAFLQTAHHLKAARIEVTVIPLQSSGLKRFNRRKLPANQDGQEQINLLREKNIKVIPVQTTRLSFIFDPISMRNAVSDFVDDQQVDAIISWHHEAALLGRICEKHKIFFACRAVGNYNHLTNHRRGRLWSMIITRFLSRAFTKADVIWTPSAFTRKEVLKTFMVDSQKVKVIPEGINPIFQTAERNRKQNESIRRFFYFGVWSKAKGLFDALEALGLVKKQGFKALQFHIAGWGNEKVVRQAIEDNGLQNQVKLLGKLDHQELVKALEWAQVVLLPSQFESFGLAVAEAQTAALPVIAYHSAAVTEMIEDGKTGWLVPLNRTDLLAQAIIEAIKNPDQTHRMGLAGREKIGGRFTWPQTVQQMLQDIEQAI